MHYNMYLLAASIPSVHAYVLRVEYVHSISTAKSLHHGAFVSMLFTLTVVFSCFTDKPYTHQTLIASHVC